METRDKLFTEEQYVKQLAEYSQRAAQLENNINNLIEAEEKHVQIYQIPNKQVILNKYDTLFKCKLDAFITEYSMGKDIDELKTSYLQTVDALQKSKSWTANGLYVQMLWLLSIGIMLDYETDIIQPLVKLIENENADDFVYNTLIKYRFPDWKKNTEKVLYKVPYRHIILIVTCAGTDKPEAVRLLTHYLKKAWYQGHSDCSWYGDHKYGIVHDGYWSFESGALVKVLGLDDSILKGLPYYPYDMVHWNDTK